MANTDCKWSPSGMTAEGEVPWGGFWTKTWLDTALLLGGRTNPSPGPPRLKKTPAASHPLPTGEGCHSEGGRVPPRLRPIQNLKSKIENNPEPLVPSP